MSKTLIKDPYLKTNTTTMQNNNKYMSIINAYKFQTEKET